MSPTGQTDSRSAPHPCPLPRVGGRGGGRLCSTNRLCLRSASDEPPHSASLIAAPASYATHCTIGTGVLPAREQWQNDRENCRRPERVRASETSRHDAGRISAWHFRRKV